MRNEQDSRSTLEMLQAGTKMVAGLALSDKETLFFPIWHLIKQLDKYIADLAENNIAFNEISLLIQARGLELLEPSSRDTTEVHAFKVVRNILVKMCHAERPGEDSILKMPFREFMQLTEVWPVVDSLIPEEVRQSILKCLNLESGIFESVEESMIPTESVETSNFSSASAGVSVSSIAQKLLEIPNFLKQHGILTELDTAKLNQILVSIHDFAKNRDWKAIKGILKAIASLISDVWQGSPILKLNYDSFSDEKYNHKNSPLNQLISSMADLFVYLDKVEARLSVPGSLSGPLNEGLAALGEFKINLPEGVMPKFAKDRLEAVMPQSYLLKDFLRKKMILNDEGKAYSGIRLAAAKKMLESLKEKRENLNKGLTPTLLKFNDLCRALYEGDKALPEDYRDLFKDEKIEEIIQYLLQNNFLTEDEAQREGVLKFLDEVLKTAFDVEQVESYGGFQQVKANKLLLWKVNNHFGIIGNTIRGLDNEITNTEEFIFRMSPPVFANDMIDNILKDSKTILAKVEEIVEGIDIKNENVRGLLGFFYEELEELQSSYEEFKEFLEPNQRDLGPIIIQRYCNVRVAYDLLKTELPAACLQLLDPMRRICARTDILFPNAVKALAARRKKEEKEIQGQAARQLGVLMPLVEEFHKAIQAMKTELTAESWMQWIKRGMASTPGWLVGRLMGVPSAAREEQENIFNKAMENFQILLLNLAELKDIFEKNPTSEKIEKTIQVVTENIFNIRYFAKRGALFDHPALKGPWKKVMTQIEKLAGVHPILRQIIIDEAMVEKSSKPHELDRHLPVSPKRFEVDISAIARKIREGLGSLIVFIKDKIKDLPEDSTWKLREDANQDTTESGYLRDLLQLLEDIKKATDPKSGIASKLYQFPWRNAERILNGLLNFSLDPQVRIIIGKVAEKLMPIADQMKGLFSADFKKTLKGIVEKTNDPASSDAEKFVGTFLQSGMVPFPKGLEKDFASVMGVLNNYAVIQREENHIQNMQKDLWKKIPTPPYLLSPSVHIVLRASLVAITGPIALVCKVLAWPFNKAIEFLNARKIKKHTDVIEQEKRKIHNTLFKEKTAEEIVKGNSAVTKMGDYVEQSLETLDKAAIFGLPGAKTAIEKISSQVQEKTSELPGSKRYLLEKPFGVIAGEPHLISRLLNQIKAAEQEEKTLSVMKAKNLEGKSENDLRAHQRAVNSSKLRLEKLEKFIQQKTGVLLGFAENVKSFGLLLIKEKAAHQSEFEKLGRDLLCLIEAYNRLKGKRYIPSVSVLLSRLHEIIFELHKEVLLSRQLPKSIDPLNKAKVAAERLLVDEYRQRLEETARELAETQRETIQTIQQEVRAVERTEGRPNLSNNSSAIFVRPSERSDSRPTNEEHAALLMRGVF